MHLLSVAHPAHRIAALRVRPAEPRDELALVAMLERTSPLTRYRRFHGAGDRAIRTELTRIAHPTEVHRSWVAEVDGDIVGTATLAIDRDGQAEAAFLVEDEWHRRGVGRRLFAALAADAQARNLPEVIAKAQGDNQKVREFLRSMVPGARTRFAGAGEVEIVVPVTDPVTPATAPAPTAVPVLPVPVPVPAGLVQEIA